jgi:hypothetical protein
VTSRLLIFALTACLHGVTFAGAGGVESPDLTLFMEEIERLQAAAQAVRLLCTDAVRAGG